MAPSSIDLNIITAWDSICQPAFLPSLASVPIMAVTVLDGGFSTQLVNYVGDVIDGDPLWSARFLATAPHAVYQTHLDFLNAGAEIIITNSYQASVDGFKEYLGLDRNASSNLIRESVNLAKRARETFLKENPAENRPLIAGSVGSYGASLHDGSEYNGSFIANTTRELLKKWHRPRVEALLEAGVDLLAFETIPVLEEALALLEILREYPNARAWLSFQCKDGRHIAYGDDFTDAVRHCWSQYGDQLVAIGCNCLDPNLVSSLVCDVAQDVPIVVYPNSGEQYSPDSGDITLDPPCQEEETLQLQLSSSANPLSAVRLGYLGRWSGKGVRPHITQYVEEWLNLGVRYIGGCCRTNATDVKSIRKIVKNWLLQSKH